MQSQRIKLKVSIKKITMNIKFPCSLAIQLKHDTAQDYRKLYQLKNGQCTVGQLLETECQVLYNTIRLRYEDKKIAINIFMVSTSGKVASGSVSFSIFGKEPGNPIENVQFLEKCPDKQAKIYYTFAFEVLRKTQRLDKTILSEDNKKRQVFESVNLPVTARTPRNETYNMKADHSPRHQELKQSLVEDVLVFDRKPSYKNQIKQRGQNKFYTQHFKTETNHIVSRSKSKHTRENAIKTIQSFYSPAQKIKEQTYQNFQQSQEFAKLRNKLKFFESNEKSLAQNLREFKQDSQRKKNKINQLESGKLELQESVRIKQDKIKKLEKQLKDISQQNEQATNQLKSMKSQLEIRQNINREQVKKLEEKYRQSELQREKITEEYNKSLKTFEESQKKYQLLVKEKEKNAIQQKNKVSRKIQTQNNSLSELEKEKRQMQHTIQELNKDKKTLINDKLELQSKLNTTFLQLEQAINKLKVGNEKMFELQRQVQALKASDSQKHQIKKKLSESQILITSLTEKYNTLQKNARNTQQKLLQTKTQLQKKAEQKNQLYSKFNQIKKNYDNLKFSEEQRLKQSKSLAQINNTANSRISELKNKLETERRSIQQIQREYEDRHVFISNQKNSLATQVSELRWEIEKHISANSQLNVQLKSHHQDVFRLSQNIIQKEERIKQLEQIIKQATVSGQYLNASNSQLQKKKKELQTYLKEQGQQFAQLKKKHEKSQRDLADSKERVKILQIALKEKGIEFQKKIKEKDESIQAKNIQLQSLQFEQKSILDESSFLKQAAISLQNQMNHLRQTISNNRRQLENQQGLILKLKLVENDLKKIIFEKQQEIGKKDKQIEHLTKTISKINAEGAQYRNNCVLSLEKYFQQLLKDSQNISIRQNFNRINAYPNEKISSLQIQYVQKVLQNSNKTRNKISQIYQQKEFVQYEFNKVKLQLEQQVKRLEQQLLKERQKGKILNQEISKHQEVEKSILMKDQELLTVKQREIEHCKTQIRRKQEQSYELQAQIHILISQYDTLKQENRELEEKFLSFRSQEIKGKAQFQAKTKETAFYYQQQIEQLKLFQTQLEKKIALLQKELSQKLQTIRKYEIEHNGIVYQCDKRQNRINQVSDRLRESQVSVRQVEKALRQKQRQLKKALENIEHVNNLLQLQKEKHEETQYKVQEQNHLILTLNKDIQQMKQQINAEQHQNSQHNAQHKLRFESLKTLNEKLVLQIKQLKEKNIALSSQLQLKKYMISQLQNNAKIQKELKQQLKNELQKKKQTIHNQTQEISMSRFKIKEYQEKSSTLEEQKDSLVSANEKLKQSLNQLRMNSRQDRQSGDQIAHLQRQVNKLVLQKRQLEQFYQRQIAEVKSTTKESKRTQTSRISKEEQLKRKIKSYQKLLESNHPDLALERSRIIKQTQREKRQLVSKIQSLEQKLEHLQNQTNTLKHKNRKQIDRLNSQLEDLRQQSNTKDFLIRNQQYQLDNLNNLLNQMQNNKQKLQNQLNNEKGKLKKLQQTLQIQQKEYREKLKKIQQEEIKNVATEIQKKIMSSKFKRLNMNFNEVQKMMLSGYYKEIEDIIASTVKEKRY